MNTTHLLTSAARAQPNAPAVRIGNRTVDYLALEMAARRVSAVVRDRYGIEDGDRVAVMLPDVPEFAFVYYGILRAGGVVVVVDPDMAADGVASRLDDSGATMMFGWHALAEVIDQVVAPAAMNCLFVEPREFSRLLAGVQPRRARRDGDRDEPAVVLYTPAYALPGERITITHGELIDGARRLTRAASLGRTDVVVSSTPLGAGNDPGDALNAVIAVGASLLLLGELDDDALLQAAVAGGASVLISDQTAITRLIDTPVQAGAAS